jgi:hypothetical protein
LGVFFMSFPGKWRKSPSLGFRGIFLWVQIERIASLAMNC